MTRVSGLLNSEPQLISVVLVCTILTVVGGAAAIGVSSTLGFIVVGLVVIVAMFVTMASRPHYGIILILITLALGSETLDVLDVASKLPISSLLRSVSSSASVSLSDFVVFLAFLASSLHLLVDRSHRNQDGNRQSISKALIAYLLICVLASLFANLFVPFSNLAWSLLYIVRLGFACLPFLIVSIAQPNTSWLKRFIGLYVLLAWIPMTRLVWEIFGPGGIGLESYYRGENAGGFSAMGLGTYLISVIAVCIAVIETQSEEPRILSLGWAWLSILSAIATIVLTDKRSSMVGLLVVVGMWLALKPRLTRARRALIAGSVILLLFAVGVASGGGLFARLTLDSARLAPWLREMDQRAYLPSSLTFLADYNLDPNITTRVAQWYYALQAAIKYPLGVGFRGMVVGPYSYPHNQYLQILAELGSIGLVCFFWLVRSVLQVARPLYNMKDPLSSALGAGVLLGFAGMLAQGMFEESFHNWDGMALLWLLTGLATIQFQRKATSVPNALALQNGSAKAESCRQSSAS